MRRLARAFAIAALLVWPLASARLAHASYEEFQSLDVGRQEEDDENLLDHVLVRPPEDWYDDWRSARGAFRSSQGCFTSGQWYLDNDLRVRVPMGDTTYLDLNIREVSDDESVYGWTRFDVRFPLPHAGLWGLRFIPTFNKSQQDVALLWDAGTAATPYQMNVTLGLEDLFNKFWALRQTRVGDDSEPYERHPYEPALSLAWRGAGPRVELNGKWLTPSRKRFDTHDPAQRRTESLWGAKGDAHVAQRLGPGALSLRFEQLQASSYAYYELASPGDHHKFARRWRAEAAWSQPVGMHGRIALRYFYQERDQVWRPPISNSSLGVIDRMPMVEGSFRLPAALTGRLGAMRNRITVVDDGRVPVFTWGTRVETRAFLSLQKQFGRVRIQGTECIELDHEAYPVSFHHDKGFVHVQTTF